MPATTATIEIHDPTERSMPPEIISTVIPMERMPRVDTCWRTLLMLRGERNTGDTMLMMMTSAIRTKTMPNCCDVKYPSEPPRSRCHWLELPMA